MLLMDTSFERLLRAFMEKDKASSFLQSPSYFAPLNHLNLSPYDVKAIKFGTKNRELY